MALRHNPLLRKLIRKVPVLGHYDRALTKLDEKYAALDRSFAEYRAGKGHWVPVGHFYSPYTDLEMFHREFGRIYGSPLDQVPGVDLRLDQQRELLAELDAFAPTIVFPKTEAEAKAQNARYWSENPAFGDTDARFLTAMLHHFKPARLLELGCGYSSAVTLDARDRYLDTPLELTFVDPYPQLLESLVRESDKASVTILPIGTQQVQADLLQQLQAGDVLFIDSTHVSKPGSDVNHNFFEVLPALRSGVLIHLHDIFPRFEYPHTWIEEQRAWTEQYVLRAFLQYNTAFEIVLWVGLLGSIDGNDMVRNYPLIHTNGGGSIWLRKR